MPARSGSSWSADIWSGREPSIEAKRQAKTEAWGDGARQAKTCHRVVLGDARELPLEPSYLRIGERRLAREKTVVAAEIYRVSDIYAERFVEEFPKPRLGPRCCA